MPHDVRMLTGVIFRTPGPGRLCSRFWPKTAIILLLSGLRKVVETNSAERTVPPHPVEHADPRDDVRVILAPAHLQRRRSMRCDPLNVIAWARELERANVVEEAVTIQMKQKVVTDVHLACDMVRETAKGRELERLLGVPLVPKEHHAWSVDAIELRSVG